MTTGSLNNWKLEPGAGGLARLALSTDAVEAEVYLQGAHLTRLFDKERKLEMLWMHSSAPIEPGRAIRGGVPLAFPWFAQHTTHPDWPNHGFARNMMWSLLGEFDKDGLHGVRLRLIDNELTRLVWPHAFEATMEIAVGAGIADLAMIIKNTDKTPFHFENAFHPYFPVRPSAIDSRVDGLDGIEYIDKVDRFHKKRQEGTLTFHGSTDKVFLNTEGPCVLHHPGQPAIRFVKSGSRETVIWNPGPPLSNPGGPPAGFMCVEQANCADHPVTLKPGESHTMTARYTFKD